jgi:hypothetical protein
MSKAAFKMSKAAFKTLQAGVRPSRLAVLVDVQDPHWSDTGRRVIEVFSKIWGGSYNLIVPTDGISIHPYFWDLLEAFDPDYVTRYYKTGLDLKLSMPDRYDKLLIHNLTQLHGPGPHSSEQQAEMDRIICGETMESLPIDPLLEKSLQERLAPFHFEDQILHLATISNSSQPSYPLTALRTVLPHAARRPTTITLVDVRMNGVLQLAADSMFGAATAEHLNDIEETGASVTKLSFTKSEASDLFKLLMQTESRPRLDEVVRATGGMTSQVSDILSTCPFALSMTGLSQYRSLTERTWETPLIVVVGKTFEDFCLFFCLSRIRSHVHWLLPEWLDAFDAIKNATGSDEPSDELRITASHATSFASAILRGLVSSPQRRVAVLSVSHALQDLQQFISRLDRAPFIRPLNSSQTITGRADFPDSIKKLVAEPQVVFNTDNYAVVTTQQVEEGQVAGFFPTPKPKGFTTIVPYEHRWVTELRVEDHLYPRHPSLGIWLVRHSGLSPQEARSGSRGICYSCPNVAYFGGDVDTILVRPQIHVPAGIQVFEHLAESAGKKCNLSDKGFYSRDTVEKLGGLARAATIFRDSKRFAVLAEYLRDSKDQAAAGMFLASDRRRYLKHASITSLLGTTGEAIAFVDDCIARHIFHRGLILKCDFCRNADWFSVGDIDDGFACKRCRREQPILSRHAMQQPEPVWFYQLDEIAYQGLRNDMQVPLLALDFLRRKSKSFLYSDELELWESGSKPLMEIDICCICDGVLMIGEAKSTDRIEGGGAKEVSALEKYRDAARMFGARRFVLATSKMWLPQTLLNAGRIFRDTGIEVLPLTVTEIYSA